jgi:chromosome segregation ATPase
MVKVKLLEQFIQEDLNEGLFDVVTKSKAFLKNPIAATKITNNGKKLAQSEIDNAANELDYEKRKLAAKKAADSKIEAANKAGNKDAVQKIKDDQNDSTEVLKAAHDQKADALKDKVESIKDRIDDLATNSTLKELGSLVKTASRVKRNEVLLKGADDEEKKQLKIQMKDDMEKIQDLKKGFGEYEGSDKEEKKSEAEPKKEPKAEPKDEPVAEPKKEPTAEPKKEPSEPKKEPQLTAISKSSDKKEEPKEPSEKLASARADLADAQRNMADVQNRIKSINDKMEKIRSGKYDKKEVSDPKAELASLESKKKEAESRLADAQDDVKFTADEADKAEKEFASKDKKAAESFNGLKSFKDFVRG